MALTFENNKKPKLMLCSHNKITLYLQTLNEDLLYLVHTFYLAPCPLWFVVTLISPRGPPIEIFHVTFINEFIL